jgi:hypothetical protein
MDAGAAVATRHGVDNVSFRQEDVRGVSRDSHGEFDVVYCLGLLYHLDATEAFALLESVFELCGRLLIVDTLISLEPELEVRHRDGLYEGERVREHDDADPPEARRARLLRSVDSTFAFRFAKSSLVRALSDVGFESVLECHAPPEVGKAADRVTIVALKGEPVSLATYPWLNDSSEAEIERRLRSR